MNQDPREKLISRIRKIDNPDILNEVNRLLNINLDEDVYITTKEQKSAIRKAQEQIKTGEIIDGDSADNEIDKWLEE
ncbi:MAG: hypothetical protein ACFHWX_09960 [Bacteroidota bacterium]